MSKGCLVGLPLAAMLQALIHCPRLNKLSITDCPALETLMLWTDELTELDLTGVAGART